MMEPNSVLDGGDRRCKYFEFFGRCTESTEGQMVGGGAVQKDVGGGRRCSQERFGHVARGASGLCISHGGGTRCQKPDCQKGAEGRTAYCEAHSGGRRCEELGCTKSAEGRTDKCIAHGGGLRCSQEGCGYATRGKTGVCIRHGGGKRCQKENCTKRAEGLSGLCISHGGCRRCQHGGGVCQRGVHGGTQFCVAHGGGKRCAAIPECTKSARGRTDFCVRHGGGKRCQAERCGKSAQGATDFCNKHDGGKRCSGGQPESEFGQGEPPCYLFAREKTGTGLCLSHGYLVQDKWAHGGAILGSMVQDPTTSRMFFYEAHGDCKRCQSEGCEKSAQGSTGFCNAHAGVKRCSWGQRESEFGQGEEPCNSFAWEMTGLCTLHGARSIGALVQDKLVRRGATLRPMFLEISSCTRESQP